MRTLVLSDLNVGVTKLERLKEPVLLSVHRPPLLRHLRLHPSTTTSPFNLDGLHTSSTEI